MEHLRRSNPVRALLAIAALVGAATLYVRHGDTRPGRAPRTSAAAPGRVRRFPAKVSRAPNEGGGARLALRMAHSALDPAYAPRRTGHVARASHPDIPLESTFDADGVSVVGDATTARFVFEGITR